MKCRSRATVLNWGCSHPKGVREGTSWGANFSAKLRLLMSAMIIQKTIHQTVQKWFFLPDGVWASKWIENRWSRVIHTLINKTMQQLNAKLSKREPSRHLCKTWPEATPRSPPLISTPDFIYRTVLFNLFVIVEPLTYFRVCHGTPKNKN